MAACSTDFQLADPLADVLAGKAPLSHRAWLFICTSWRRKAGRAHSSAVPVVRVQLRKHGSTFCGTITDAADAPNGAELFRVDADLLGPCTVQARNVRVCGSRCICGGRP